MANLSDLFSSGVTLLSDTTHTSSATWTKPVTGFLPTDLVVIDVWGGGGGGGRGNGSPGYGGGGGGGAHNEIAIPFGDLPASVAMVVGAGGAAGASNGANGADGGYSSFLGIVAYGGGGGNGGSTAGGGGGGIFGPGISGTTSGFGGSPRDVYSIASGNALFCAGIWGGGDAVAGRSQGLHGGAGAVPTATAADRNSIFGGAAGGCISGTGGVSVYGGAGGTGASLNGGVRGGGGFGSGNATAGNGGRGEIRIRIFRGK